MSAEPLLPVYLLTGSDRPKIRRALRRLKARVGQDSVEVLEAPEATGADAVAACNALGLFAADAARLVIVEGAERWRAEDVDAVAAYLADPAPGSVLALVTDEAPKSRALADLSTKKGRVLAYDVPKPRDLPTWIRSQFERLGTPADLDGARALLEVVGDDVTALTSEVEKIAAWARGQPVARRDVEALAVAAHDTPSWAVADAWGARDAAALLSACESALEQGEEPFIVAVRLGGQVAFVRAVQRLADEGLGVREIAKRLRRHEFRVRKALGQAENYTREELDDAVVRLAALDAALKGASRLAGEVELERAAVELVGGAATAARR